MFHNKRNDLLFIVCEMKRMQETKLNHNNNNYKKKRYLKRTLKTEFSKFSKSCGLVCELGKKLARNNNFEKFCVHELLFTIRESSMLQQMLRLIESNGLIHWYFISKWYLKLKV